MMRIEIHFLSDCPEFLPAVAGWIYDEWAFLYPGKTVHHIEQLLRKRLQKKRLPLTLVAVHRGEPIGTVSLKHREMETRPRLTPWVTSLYVVRARRGRGVGSKLMRAVENIARELAISRLFLFTAEPGLARRFYEPLGWSVHEHVVFESYPVIIMAKELGRPRRVPRK